MKPDDIFALAVTLLFTGGVLGCVYGWIANIVKLALIVDGGQIGMVVLRGCGVVMPPLGAVLGWV